MEHLPSVDDDVQLTNGLTTGVHFVKPPYAIAFAIVYITIVTITINFSYFPSVQASTSQSGHQQQQDNKNSSYALIMSTFIIHLARQSTHFTCATICAIKVHQRNRLPV